MDVRLRGSSTGVAALEVRVGSINFFLHET